MIKLGGLLQYLELTAQDAAGDGAVPLDAALELTGIAPLNEAGPNHLAFVSDRRYLDALADTTAGCVLLKAEWQERCPVPALVVDNPYLYYARATAVLDNAPTPAPGVHATAVVAEDATLGADISIGPGACIESGAVLGDGVVIGAGAFVGEEAQLGAGTRLHPNVTIYHRVVLGEGCAVHANTVIGSDGFGFAPGPAGWEKIRQLGTVRIGNGVDIGASVAIDRGALGDTVIADGVIIDNQVHIAHNIQVGERTAIAGCVGFAGSSTIGADCTFAGQVGVSGHLHICDNAHFTGQARVARDVKEPGTYGSGTPLDTTKQWGRNAVRFGQLDAMAKRLKELEERFAALEPRD